MAARETWANRPSFILAAVGSAIGLGNLWRFPYVCYENGGGAFLVAYLVALVSAGMPILLLEFSIGHKWEGSAPSAFRKIKKNLEWVGWSYTLVCFAIVVAYSIIMAYCFRYVFASFTESWGTDPVGFWTNNVLGLTDSPYSWGEFKWPLLIGLLATWIWIVASTWKGTKTVSKVVWFTVLVPWALLVVFVIRSLTLPGAIDGLNLYLTPDFARLTDLSVWLAAYTQVFYSLSVGSGIMIAYGSFLPRKAELANNAYIIALADGLTAFIGGLAVFGALGFHAHNLGKPIQEVIGSGGFGLVFQTYPAIISSFPYGAPIFGVMFFLMLLTLAIDSAFSMTETVAAAFKDRWGWGQKRANLTVGVIGFCVAVPLCSGAGLYWMDIVDHFMSSFGLVLVSFSECVIIGYLVGSGKMRKYINGLSEIRLGAWWDFVIKVLTPVFLLVLIGAEIVSRVQEPYGGMPRSAEFIAGWLLLIGIPVASYFFAKKKSGKEAV
jgi:NSS family neurotransmitter:Na+ symporter